MTAYLVRKKDKDQLKLRLVIMEYVSSYIKGNWFFLHTVVLFLNKSYYIVIAGILNMLLYSPPMQKKRW